VRLCDVGLRFLGPGRPFAPETYTIACFSFDRPVAAYVAAAHGLGQRRGRKRRPAFGVTRRPVTIVGCDSGHGFALR
jgi:hypothetical protein